MRHTDEGLSQEIKLEESKKRASGIRHTPTGKERLPFGRKSNQDLVSSWGLSAARGVFNHKL
jgi:hypothetical protein